MKFLLRRPALKNRQRRVHLFAAGVTLALLLSLALLVVSNSPAEAAAPRDFASKPPSSSGKSGTPTASGKTTPAEPNTPKTSPEPEKTKNPEDTKTPDKTENPEDAKTSDKTENSEDAKTPESGRKDKEKGHKAAVGKVSAKTSANFTIETQKGPVVVVVSSATIFHQAGNSAASYADLGVGDQAVAVGEPSKDGLQAKLVQILPAKTEKKETEKNRQQFRGKVTSSSATSLTISGRGSQSQTFTVNEKTKFKGTTSPVAVGTEVVVLADKQDKQLTALAVGALKDMAESGSND